MEARQIQFLVDACEGRLRSGAGTAKFCGVSTDSRDVGAGNVFVALAGDRFDGQDFLEAALQRGAVGWVVRGGRPLPPCPPDYPVVEVEDARAALGRLAKVWRRQFRLPVVAVAGSNGKTTTKELLAAVLRRRFRTLWSRASFNNDVGVPLTLLDLTGEHEVAVVEAGTNHPGELEVLVRMIQPQMGVLTSLGREHLGHFQTVEAVAAEEGILAEHLPCGGTLFLGGDSPLAADVARRCGATVETIGLGEANTWRAKVLELRLDCVRFSVRGPVAEFDGEYLLPFPGRHQVINALLAVAVGARLGVEPGEVAAGLAGSAAAPRRMEVRTTGGVWVLDDAYNANVDSMLAALETLREIPCLGRRIAVLGDMAETGEYGPDLHAEVGRRAAAVVDRLYAVGDGGSVTAEAARGAGLVEVQEFGDTEATVGALRREVRPGDVVLVKGSRAARLERISDALCPRAEAA